MRVILNIDVPDLKAATDFYSAALGLKLNRLLSDDVAELSGASISIYLLQKPGGTQPSSNPSSARTYSRHWTPVHLDFVVDNVAEAARRAVGAGAIQENDCIEWNGSRCITLSDPFGHGFCFIEFDQETYGSGD
jgi:predicted lactoylglutathione lyase